MKNLTYICATASFVLAGALAIGSNAAYAHHPSPAFGGDTGGPISTLSATTLPQGIFSAGINLQYINVDPFSDEELIARAEEDLSPHSTDYVLIPSLGFAYGITENFTVSLSLPYVLQDNFREVHHGDEEEEEEEHHEEVEVENIGDIKGFGDLSVLGQYRFFEDGDTQIEAALLFGIQIPTGNTHEKTPEGERLEAEHQPGSGSWDPMVGVAVTKRFGNMSVDASFLYTFATEGSQDTTLGDRFFYGLGVTYRPEAGIGEAAWDLILELNGENVDQTKVGGVVEEHGGGHIIYLSPGVRFNSPNAWSAHLSVGIAVLNDMNGSEPDADFRVLTGFSKAF